MASSPGMSTRATSSDQRSPRDKLAASLILSGGIRRGSSFLKPPRNLGVGHMRLHPMRTKPARQPEAVTAGFEGQCNPRDLAAGLDRLVAPAMQQAKQPFWTRLQLLARLALNAGKHTGNQPTRLAHLDDGNDRYILVQGDVGSAQVVRLGHQGTPSVSYSDDGAISSPPAP